MTAPTSDRLRADAMRRSVVNAIVATGEADDTNVLAWADAEDEAGDSVRAEFIRCNVHVWRCQSRCPDHFFDNLEGGAVPLKNVCDEVPGGPWLCSYPVESCRADGWCRYHTALDRQCAILKENEVKWRSTVQCWCCKGAGSEIRDVACFICAGSGDMGFLTGRRKEWFNFPVEWRYGLPYSVLIHNNERHGEFADFRIMIRLARQIIASHPTVSRVFCQSVRPHSLTGKAAAWWNADVDYRTGQYDVPGPVFESLVADYPSNVVRVGGPESHFVVEFPTTHAAQNAFALSFAKWARAINSLL